MILSIAEKNKAIYNIIFLKYRSLVIELIRLESQLSAQITTEKMEKEYDTYGMGNKFATVPLSESIKKSVESTRILLDEWSQILNHAAHVFIDNKY